MNAVDLSLLILLIAGLVCAIIELGLSAYSVWAYRELYGYYNTLTESSYSRDPPSQISFLVFCSVWAFLVTIVLLAIPFAMRSRGRSSKALGFGSLVLNTITMIFWLAGFAALSAAFLGYAPVGYAGALLAFAVISWLIFLALTILNFLTAFGVLRSERPGHHAMFGRGMRGTNSTPMTTVTAGPKV